MTDELSQQVAAALRIDEALAWQVVRAFERFVAEPLAKKFAEMRPTDIARRNPFMYAALGADDVDSWAERVLADMLSSTAEGLVGNWIEEVARIVSGGTKPGSGVDLQLERDGDTVELYAIQTTGNTKNAGGTRSDVRGLTAAAGALRAQRRHVDLFVGYIFGRQTTTTGGVLTRLSSADFWNRISGDRDFGARLLHVCNLLAPSFQIERLTGQHRERLVAGAREIFGNERRGIDWERVSARPLPRVSNAPRRARRRERGTPPAPRQ